MKKIIKLEELNLNRVSFSYGDIIESEPIRNELEINYFDLGFLCNESITNFESVLQGLWNSFINLQADNIEKIHNVLIEEYNPLDNYSGETITDYGEIKTTHEKGEQVNTFEKGEQVVNLVSGKRKTTLGQATDTQINYTVNSESANLTNNFNANEKIETNNAQRVNESDSFTDTSTNETYTDTNTNEAYTDTDTTEAYKIKETKHGNLGVTQSQTMVKNEIFLRNKYNFYSIIIKMFVDNYLLFA